MKYEENHINVSKTNLKEFFKQKFELYAKVEDFVVSNGGWEKYENSCLVDITDEYDAYMYVILEQLDDVEIIRKWAAPIIKKIPVGINVLNFILDAYRDDALNSTECLNEAFNIYIHLKK